MDVFPTRVSEPPMVGLPVLVSPKTFPLHNEHCSFLLWNSIKGFVTEGLDPRPSEEYSYPITPY